METGSISEKTLIPVAFAAVISLSPDSLPKAVRPATITAIGCTPPTIRIRSPGPPME